MNKEDQNLTIVYHCYCTNTWEKVVRRQLSYFRGCSIHCSQIGSEKDERKLQEIANELEIDLTIRREEDAGSYEHLAMEWMAELSTQNPDGLTIYFHTKGISSNNPKGKSWRNYLSHVFLRNWESSLEQLSRSNKEATGSWYCYYPEDPDMNRSDTHFFAGNFWMAKNRYINSLPNYEKLRTQFSNGRYLCERFIGLKSPDVLFLDQEEVLPVKGSKGVYKKIRRLKWLGWQFPLVAGLYAYLAKN